MNNSIKIQGFTLIELMISIAVTSIVLVAVINLFINNTLAYNLQQNIVNLQEEGRYASQTLSQSLMLAGYSETNPSMPALRFKDAEDADLVSVTRTEADASGATSSAEQYSTNGTRDKVRFDQLVLYVNGGFNCAGEDNWPALASGSHWKYFYINQDYQLICADSAANQEPVTSGIDAFQIQYGIDTNSPEESGYLQPNTYVNSPKADQRVVAVRFAIVIKSPELTRTTQEFPDGYTLSVLDQTFKKGDGNQQINFEDGHLRRLFFSTVKLRNSRLNKY